MKFGIRTPSIKRSITAQTTGKLNRAVKRAVNPLYGKKGMGLINGPKKAVYNKVYNKTTVGVADILDAPANSSRSSDPPPSVAQADSFASRPEQTDDIAYTSPKRDLTANTIGNVALVLGVLSLLLLFTGNILKILLGIVLATFLLGSGAAFKFIGK